MASKGSSSKPNKLVRCIMAPFRALIRVRDSYVNGLTGLSTARMSSAMPRSRSRGFPRSTTSSSSSDDDIRDLIRLAKLSSARPKDGVVPRSQSVAAAIGRIDEDRPCTFDGDVKLGMDALYPRSRSCAVEDQRTRVRVLA